MIFDRSHPQVDRITALKFRSFVALANYNYVLDLERECVTLVPFHSKTCFMEPYCIVYAAADKPPRKTNSNPIRTSQLDSFRRKFIAVANPKTGSKSSQNTKKRSHS